MSKFDDTYLRIRIDEAKDEISRIRKLIAAAKDFLAKQPVSEIMTSECRETLVARKAGELETLATYDAALEKKDQQALAVIEWFVDSWKRQERLIRITKTSGDENAIPAIPPPPLTGDSRQDPPEAEAPMPWSPFDAPAKGENSPIPAPDTGSSD